MSHSVEEVIEKRRTIHAFKPGEVPEAILTRALELALLAPNHKLTFPWRFIRLRPGARARLADVAAELKGKKKALAPAVLENIRAKYKTEGSITLFAMKKTDDAHQAREDYAAVACAIQNFSLYLWDKGFGTKWSTGGAIHDPRTYELANLNPSEFELVGLVWAGAFLRVPPTPARPPLGEALHTVD